MGDDGSRIIDVRGDDEHQILAKETRLVDEALRNFPPSVAKGELKRHHVTFQYENFTHAFCPEEAAAKGIWTKTFATAYRRTAEPSRC